MVRERAAVENYDLPQSPVGDCETLLLTGERGPPALADAVRTLDDRLPASRLVELDGVGHVGTQSAPEQIAPLVKRFCQETAIEQ